MTAKELRESLKLEVLTEPDPQRLVKGGYTGDLLSWVMGRAQRGDAWVTIMTNRNILAVASLADTACIIVAEDSSVEADVVTLAEEKGINLYRSGSKGFDLCCRIGSLLGI